MRGWLRPLSTTLGGFATTNAGEASWKIRIVVHSGLREASRFGVLAHELAHVFLGHLGTDWDHWWPGRFNLSHAAAEVEAEAVAHVVARRFGLIGSSAEYIAGHIKDGVPQDVSMDMIAKVAGKIEKFAEGTEPAPKPRPPDKAKQARKAAS
jgi:hypothetical protein